MEAKTILAIALVLFVVSACVWLYLRNKRKEPGMAKGRRFKNRRP